MRRTGGCVCVACGARTKSDSSAASRAVGTACFNLWHRDLQASRLVVPSCVVARLSVCPPPARPAPGPSSFSSPVVPSPPAHGVGDVGPLTGGEGQAVDGGGHASSGVSAHVDFPRGGVWPRVPPGLHLVRPLFADASLARLVSSVFSSSASVHSVGRCFCSAVQCRFLRLPRSTVSCVKRLLISLSCGY